MNTEIDGLKEVCKTVQTVKNGEQEITVIEKQIADKIREITAKIFDGTTKYRMPKQNLETGMNETTSPPFWGFGIVLQDNIQFDGNFYGNAQTMRIDMKGRIMTIWQYVARSSAYDLMTGTHTHIDPQSPDPRPSNDHEIVTHAQELAGELLEALKTRIDTMKNEKAILQKMAQAIL
jgi:hypothetical protein